MRVSVVIPSLLRGSLEPAVQSIRSQTIADRAKFQVLIGIDHGTKVPCGLAEKLGVRFAESSGRSQALALNAAARFVDADYLAFLEDDDRWHPQFLETAFAAMQGGAFVSSTTLNVTESNEIVCIGDHACPSGWVMPRATWDAVGGFDETFRWFLDLEWLGRLGEKGIERVHMVEETAPITPLHLNYFRPQLANVTKLSGTRTCFFRHRSPYPLVRRVLHPESGVARIRADPQIRAESLREEERLIHRFGHIPW